MGLVNFLVLIIVLLLLCIWWQRQNLSARTGALSSFARAASELMHSLDGGLRQAVRGKRAQRDLLALAGALASLLEEHPELITGDSLIFLSELSQLLQENGLTKEKKELVSRIGILQIRKKRG
jgi:hypothetical protein